MFTNGHYRERNRNLENLDADGAGFRCMAQSGTNLRASADEIGSHRTTSPTRSQRLQFEISSRLERDA